jgi:putative methyltransferase (TIGR04325 family)
VSWQRIVRSITPPLILSTLRSVRRRFGHAEWDYLADGWDSELALGAGWRDPSVVQTAVARWPEFVRHAGGTGPLGIAYESDGVVSDDHSAHDSAMAFAYALARASATQQRLSVLDWGGGLGHYFVLARSLFPSLGLEYDVFDLPETCAAGERLLPDVRYVAEEQALRETYDFSIAVGSLHYSRDWQTTLHNIAARTREYVYVGRLPCVRRVPSFVAVQRAHRYGYRTELLCWIINRDELFAAASSAGLSLVRELLIAESVDIAHAPERSHAGGFLFRR